MSVLIKGLNIKPCKDGFGGKGLVIIGYDDKLYAVAHEQIIPLPDHGDLIDRDALMKHKGSAYDIDGHELYAVGTGTILRMPAVIPAERSEKANGGSKEDSIEEDENWYTELDDPKIAERSEE